MKFNLFSHNIHKGFNTFGRFTLPVLRRRLRQLNPDILCLQEVQGEHRGKAQKHKAWPTEDQVSFLAAEHWPAHVYVDNARYQHGHHGNGIISRYAIEHWDNINVSSRPHASRSLLHSRIRLSETQYVHVICVHLGLFELEREEQFETLVSRVKSHIRFDQPIIIAGDFNDWRKRAGDHLSEVLDLREAFSEIHGQHAKTFPVFRPALSVDRIYYRNLQLLNCEVLDYKPWGILSDHLPLLAEFQLDENH